MVCHDSSPSSSWDRWLVAELNAAGNDLDPKSLNGFSPVATRFGHSSGKVDAVSPRWRSAGRPPREPRRSLSASVLHSGDGCADGAGIAKRPPAAFDLRDEVADNPNIRLRLLDVDRVA